SSAEKTPACSPMCLIEVAKVPHHSRNATTSETTPLASESSEQGIASAPVSDDDGDRSDISDFIDMCVRPFACATCPPSFYRARGQTCAEKLSDRAASCKTLPAAIAIAGDQPLSFCRSRS